jgi:hypothetical protein
MRRRDSGLLRLVALGVLLAALPPLASAGSDNGPVVITTDTPEYCRKLLDRISEAVHAAPAPPPNIVDTLSSEGQRLCDEGLTRPGILRLRRALILLQEDPPGP